MNIDKNDELWYIEAMYKMLNYLINLLSRYRDRLKTTSSKDWLKGYKKWKSEQDKLYK